MLSLFVGVGYSQYYDNNNYDNNYGYYEDDYSADRDYDDYTYNADYENNYLNYHYGYDAALPYIRAHRGRIYFFHHPYRDVYFVIIGRRVFVIPEYRLHRMIHQTGWMAVPMERFIALSCFGLHYYDNYIRFNYYFDHYRKYRYNDYYNTRVRSNYRTYFRGRRSNSHYFNNWDRVMKKRLQLNSSKIKNYNRRYDNPYNRTRTQRISKVNRTTTRSGYTPHTVNRQTSRTHVKSNDRRYNNNRSYKKQSNVRNNKSYTGTSKKKIKKTSYKRNKQNNNSRNSRSKRNSRGRG